MDRQPTLAGERLLLRPLRAEDWEALWAVASDREIWALHPAHDRWQEPVFRAFFEDALAKGGALLVIDKANGRAIGSSRFQAFDPADGGSVEIGWTFLARDHWGSGANAEMKRLMLAHAFRFVERVVFRVGAANVISRKALENIGAVLTDRRETRLMAGEPVEHVAYEVTRKAFATGPLGGVGTARTRPPLPGPERLANHGSLKQVGPRQARQPRANRNGHARSEPVGIDRGKLPDERKQRDIGKAASCTAEVAFIRQAFAKVYQLREPFRAMRQRIAFEAVGIFVAVEVMLERGIERIDQPLISLRQPLLGIVLRQGPAHDVDTLIHHRPVRQHEHGDRSLGRCGQHRRGLVTQQHLAMGIADPARHHRHPRADRIGTAAKAVEDGLLRHREHHNRMLMSDKIAGS